MPLSESPSRAWHCFRWVEVSLDLGFLRMLGDLFVKSREAVVWIDIQLGKNVLVFLENVFEISFNVSIQK